MKSTLVAFTAVLLSSASAISRSDGLTLLKNVCQQYADAKSYHIEAVQERTTSNELHGSWEKELLVAIVAPNGKYRYEGRSGHGSAILVSDGETRWAYHLDEHLYTRALVSADAKEKSRIMPEEEMAAQVAKSVVKSIVSLGTQLRSATLLHDERIVVNGRKIKCRVIHIAEDDFRTHKPESKREETLWIDGARNLIVRIQRRTDSYITLAPSRVHIPMLIEETTVFSVAQLGNEEESSFTFSPPQDAKLVEAFPDTMTHGSEEHSKEFVGKQAPDIQLKGSGGKVTSLSMLRGKPVFIEFWATWCAPCIDLMPELKTLYSQTAESVVWIGIDSDEDPKVAKAYVSQEQISWPNYHDEDGSFGVAFQREGIPLGVLIDADGKITFYKSGYDISDLRTALAKISPEFAKKAESP
jgi:thiol-disulfide isomerase/thioredoxin/outer membrane lipoprotein-sorting protein